MKTKNQKWSFRLMKQKPCSISTLVIFLITTLLANAVALSLYAQNYVTRDGNTFCYKGGPFRFIGVNLRGIHYYSDNDIKLQVQEASNMGAKVIRIFLPRNDKSNVAVGDALANFLYQIGTINSDIKVLPAFTNNYNDNPYYVNGDAGNYCYNAAAKKNLLCPTWFTSSFRNPYKLLVGDIITRFKNDDRIFGWELGNELQAGNATAMLDFAYEMGWYIKNLGAKQMVSTGFIGINHAINGNVNNTVISQMYKGPWGVLYSSSPFDFGSVHAYNNEQADPSVNSCVRNPQWTFYDINWFVNNNYPYIVGEGGFDGAFNSHSCHNDCGNLYNYNCNWETTPIPDASSNRKYAMQATIDKFFNEKSCDGYLQWGFMVGGDNQEGDCCSGMDTQFHTDWTDLWNMYNVKANSLPKGGSSSCGGGGGAICERILRVSNLNLTSGDHHYYASEGIILYNSKITSTATVTLHANKFAILNTTLRSKVKTLIDPCTATAKTNLNNIVVSEDSIINNEDLSSQNEDPVISQNKFEIYPNPFKDELTFSGNSYSSDAPIYLNISNVYGQVVMQKRIDDIHKDKPVFTISTKNISAGIYVCTLSCQGEVLIRKKIIKIK